MLCRARCATGTTRTRLSFGPALHRTRTLIASQSPRPAHSRPWCTAAASKMSVQYCCLTAPWPRALERSGNNVQRDRARPHCQAPPNRADVRRRRGGVQARQGHCSATRDRARWLRWRHNAGRWAAVHVGADVMITKPGLQPWDSTSDVTEAPGVVSTARARGCTAAVLSDHDHEFFRVVRPLIARSGRRAILQHTPEESGAISTGFMELDTQALLLHRPRMLTANSSCDKSRKAGTWLAPSFLCTRGFRK